MYVTVCRQQTVQDTNFHTSNFKLQLFLGICFLLLLCYTKAPLIEVEKVDICKNNMGCLALLLFPEDYRNGYPMGKWNRQNINRAYIRLLHVLCTFNVRPVSRG